MRAAVLALVAAAFVAAAPTLPNQYYVSGTITLPYGNITEPFRTYYDGVNNKQRVEYYEGLDTYITRGDLSVTYQVNPVVDKFTCFSTPGAVNVSSFFPDLTPFVPVSGRYDVYGQPAALWQYNFTEGGRINSYNFYVSLDNNRPLQYEWVGYDTLLGSHFDQYVINYYEFIPGTSRLNGSTFDEPSIPCGPFPSATGFNNPAVNGVASMFPAVPTPHFNEWAAAHNKSYSGGDATSREHNFHRNVRFVNAMNRKYKSTGSNLVLAVNLMADHSDAELLQRASVRNNTKPAFNGAAKLHAAPADPSVNPPEVNWITAGAVTVVKDQGICGSCWSFGTAETLEGANFRKTGQLVELSQQELMDCSWPYLNFACDGGEDFQAYQWIMSNGGLSLAEEYGPYLMADGLCHSDRARYKVNITGYVNVTSQSEPALLDAIANVGPISVAIDASLRTFSFYSSGVFNDPNCASDPADLDHAVLAVGYGTDPTGGDYWLVKNSWSTHWGDQGYVKISRQNNDCGVATAPTYVEM